jgi:hypothetical protein
VGRNQAIRLAKVYHTSILNNIQHAKYPEKKGCVGLELSLWAWTNSWKIIAPMFQKMKD